MNKKIIAIIVSILLLLIINTGCIEENKKDTLTPVTSNNPPIGIISAPEIAFFDETIEFSAISSYDKDGSIEFYEWDLGDYTILEGEKVKHNYIFNNNFEIDYPIIYTVNLFVKDNNGSTTATSHQIKIYPKSYQFFLSNQNLNIEKSVSSSQKIKGSGLFGFQPPQILKYELSKSIFIKKCSWNATIYLQKPLFLIAKKISIIFYDTNGSEITKQDNQLGSFLWTKKTVECTGSFTDDEKLKSVELVIYGLSLRKEISILYDDNYPSNICFDFTNI